MKKKGVSDDEIRWLYEMAEESGSAYLNIVRCVNDLYENASGENADSTRAQALKLLTSLYKIRHGTKETKHSIDVTSKQYVFSVEVKANDGNNAELEANKQAVVSLEHSSG